MPNDDALTELQVDSDQELFDGALSDDTPETPEVAAETPPSETPTELGEQPRDPQGRYAPKPGDTPAEVVPPTDGKPPTQPEAGDIPPWRLREESEARRVAEAKLAERDRLIEELRRNPPKPQEPPKAEEKPDPLLDPQGYEAYLERKFENRFRAERGEISLRSARRAHGELFDKAYQAVQSSDQAARDRIANSPDPGEELIAWHRERETMREVGTDPNAWFQRKFEEALKDPAQAAKAIAILRNQQQPPNPAQGGIRQPSPVRLPPSLSTVTPSDAARGNPDDDDVSDEALFRHATRA